MEQLFTEEQWRAIVHIEGLNEGFPGRRGRFIEMKRICGRSFADGEYFLARAASFSRPKDFVGPPEPHFHVYERQSDLFVTGWSPNRAHVLHIARRDLALMGAFWSEWRAKECGLVAAERAADEAHAAIQQARALRKVSKRARAVFEASNGQCHYCGEPLVLESKSWHIEHKVPRALFGGSEQSNLVAACAPCNRAKRDKTDLEFQHIVAMRREGRNLAEQAEA